MITHFHRLGFATLAASCLVLALPGSAAASSRRVPASICFPDTDSASDYLFERGIANQSTARERQVHCPIIDDDVFVLGAGTPSKKTAMSNLWVDGWDGNNDPGGDIKVGVCQYQPWTSAFSCSNWEQASSGTFTGGYSANFVGASTLISELTSSARSWWYPELVVLLPKRGTVGNSSIYGYVIY